MDILYEYFLVPLMRNGWFNPVNSVVYGIGLIIGIWAVFALLKKVNVKVNNGLFIAFTPFIAFAGVTRTLRDFIYYSASGQPGFLSSFTGYMSSMQAAAYDYIFGVAGNSFIATIDSYIIAWFPTPGSYLITFMLALFSLFISLLVRKHAKIECWKTMFFMGMVFFVTNASMLPVNTLLPLAYIGGVTIAWALAFFGITYASGKDMFRRFGKKFSGTVKEIFTRTNSMVLSAHFFDATATFFAIAMFTTLGGQGYTEQHFLSRWMMPYIGPGVMFLLKFVVVVPVLWYIDRFSDNKDINRFLKLAVFVLGAAPAARNLVRLMVGV